MQVYYSFSARVIDLSVITCLQLLNHPIYIIVSLSKQHRRGWKEFPIEHGYKFNVFSRF